MLSGQLVKQTIRARSPRMQKSIGLRRQQTKWRSPIYGGSPPCTFTSPSDHTLSLKRGISFQFARRSVAPRVSSQGGRSPNDGASSNRSFSPGRVPTRELTGRGRLLGLSLAFDYSSNLLRSSNFPSLGSFSTAGPVFGISPRGIIRCKPRKKRLRSPEHMGCRTPSGAFRSI